MCIPPYAKAIVQPAESAALYCSVQAVLALIFSCAAVGRVILKPVATALSLLSAVRMERSDSVVSMVDQ